MKQRALRWMAGSVALIALTWGACGKEKTDPAVSLAAEAKNLFAAEKYADAEAKYATIAVDYPTSPLAKDAAKQRDLCRAKELFLDARNLAREGRNDEAGQKLADAVRLAPDDVEVNYGVGWVYMQLAIDHLTRAASTGGQVQGDYVALAKAHAELAKGRFQRCLELNPKHWGGHRGMALYYIFNRQEDEALKALAEADKYSVKDEDKVAVARLRFQALAGEKKMEDAKKIVDEMLKNFPDRGDVYMSLAEYYLRAEPPNVAEATKALEVGVTKKFDDAGTKNQMYLMLSRLRLSQRDFDGALTAAESALAQDPFNPMFTDQYTLCYEAKITLGGANPPRP